MSRSRYTISTRRNDISIIRGYSSSSNDSSMTHLSRGTVSNAEYCKLQAVDVLVMYISQS